MDPNEAGSTLLQGAKAIDTDLTVSWRVDSEGSVAHVSVQLGPRRRECSVEARRRGQEFVLEHGGRRVSGRIELRAAEDAELLNLTVQPSRARLQILELVRWTRPAAAPQVETPAAEVPAASDDATAKPEPRRLRRGRRPSDEEGQP